MRCLKAGPLLLSGLEILKRKSQDYSSRDLKLTPTGKEQSPDGQVSQGALLLILRVVLKFFYYFYSRS